MTVAQLIAQLQTMNPDHVVIVRSGDLGYRIVSQITADVVTFGVHGFGGYMGPHEIDYYQCGDDNYETAPCVVINTGRD
jgi:hypothetical protein